jgi:cysteine-rich repeat protein
MRAAWWIVLLAGCIDSALVPCADGRACPVGFVCDDAHHGCVLPDQVAACAGMPDFAACTTSHIATGICSGGVCLPAGCGNDVVEPGELCDDGNTVGGDGCSADCRSQERCGDGFADITRGETCDDGNTFAHDGCTSACAAEQLAWTGQIAGAPPGREDAALVYDPFRRVTVMFGGGVYVDPITDSLSDTWEWNGAGWREVTPLESPPPRYAAAIAYDPLRHRVVMFGGTNAAFGDLADTWEYDGATWSRRPTPIAPFARQGAAMVWDPARKTVVMFGGLQGVTALADMWEWDGVAWREIDPPTRPPGHHRHGMVYDVAHARIVLFGGFASQTFPINDTWTFDGTTWSKLSAPDAPPQSGTLAYDPIHAVVIAIARDMAANLTNYVLDGTTWTPLPTTSGLLGSLLEGTHYVFDIERAELVEFGGYNGVESQATYVCAPGATATWLAPTATPPRGRIHTALAFDADHQTVVMFGGESGLGDTEIWDGRAWTAPAGGPPARSSHAMAWDGASHRVLMFGGSTTTVVAETWAWNGAVWTDVSTTPSPSARMSAAMAYDVDRQRVVLFGGSNIADTWEWDGAAWHDVMPASLPPIMTTPALAYDRHRHRSVLVGYVGQAAETWEWDGSAWTQITTATSPELRIGAALVYNTARQRVVLVGGSDSSSADWEWDGTVWTVAPTSHVPLPAISIAATYDEARGEIVQFGGELATFASDSTAWLGAYRGPGEEVCGSGVDVDGDGKIGCADEDCAGACALCGDHMCEAPENDRLCPTDCAAVPPICGDAYCAPGETCAADCL